MVERFFRVPVGVLPAFFRGLNTPVNTRKNKKPFDTTTIFHYNTKQREVLTMSLLKRIWDNIDSMVDARDDLYKLSVQEYANGGREYLEKLDEWISDNVIDCDTEKELRELYDLHKRVLKELAVDNFDAFLRYVEWEREPEKKFYMPRRRELLPVVRALQELADDEIDLLCVSMPPGVGKSTLAIFFICWLGGRNPLEPILTGSHNHAFIRGVYDECLRILDASGEYLWRSVFPSVSIVGTNANDCRIDLGKAKRFETLEFTTIGTGNAGLFRARQLLYCDDLVSGREVALSKERLDKLWSTYTTDLAQRKQGDHCKELHIATRWSVNDVIGRLEREHEGDSRARFISLPVCDEQGESNFNYPYGLGYTKETIEKQRQIMDDADFRALFLNEPIEREGQLYSPSELRRYFELPEREPDAILAVCDTKDRGDDYCVQPIFYQYGQDYYLESIVCDNGKPESVEARLVVELVKHNVQLARYESNNVGGRVAQKVQEQVKERGGRCKITTKYTTANKETKIIVNSPFIKEHVLFKDDSVIKDADYKRAMNMLFGYTMTGRNKHDDVVDALAMFSEFTTTFGSGKSVVMQRFF